MARERRLDPDLKAYFAEAESEDHDRLRAAVDLEGIRTHRA
jgi:hypothetical protein